VGHREENGWDVAPSRGGERKTCLFTILTGELKNRGESSFGGSEVYQTAGGKRPGERSQGHNGGRKGRGPNQTNHLYMVKRSERERQKGSERNWGSSQQGSYPRRESTFDQTHRWKVRSPCPAQQRLVLHRGNGGGFPQKRFHLRGGEKKSGGGSQEGVLGGRS